MAGSSPFRIELSDEDRRILKATSARYASPYRDVVRAKIVLYASEGLSNQEIAGRLDLPRQIVSKWRKRFFDELAVEADDKIVVIVIAGNFFFRIRAFFGIIGSNDELIFSELHPDLMRILIAEDHHAPRGSQIRRKDLRSRPG